MADLNAVVARYLDVWNETDADRRVKAIGELYTEDATYVDPLASVAGHEGLDALFKGAQEQFAGLTFALLGAVDAPHHIARFRWGLVTEPGAEPVAIGFDVAVVTEDERIERVYGFLDKVPS